VAKRFAALPGDAFAAVLTSAARARADRHALHWRAGSLPRLGLIISRKFAGSAVRRNLVKRQARALFEARTRAAGNAPVDLVVRVVAPLTGCGRRTLFDGLRDLMARVPADGGPPVRAAARATPARDETAR
jgi:ribonuclease P protein component